MEFIPEGATVTNHHHKEILRRLRNSVCCKHPELWHRKNWLLLHNNAPAHRSVLVQEELAQQQVTVLPHPPDPPDLAPCDFFFFSHLKEKLCGCRFQSAKKIITATRAAVRNLPQISFSSVSSSYTNIGRLA
jgi:histone-lysine N-methyltransferase SETMAR